ncbi:MAG: beta-ketoacyl-[acyl-carrier-protein] synthase family protein, partial [Myxococcota bacterium]
MTGTGLCCHMGDDLDRIAQDIRLGCNTPFETYGPAVEYKCRCQIIGTYPGDLSPATLDISKQEARFMGRASLLALRAARGALAQSGAEAESMAVVVGTGTGDVAANLEVADKLRTQGSARRISPTVVPRLMASTVSANLVNVLRSKGPSFTATAACATGAYNLLWAATLIERGMVDVALAGGVEIADFIFFPGFDAMRAYNSIDNDHPERASRPYAADRAGFIFSEAAGVVVLESRASAEARGAEILGVLRGFGMSSDGVGNMVAPDADGAYRAMVAALDSAGMHPEQIDYINTHGTSTPLGDISEFRAIRRLMGEHRVAYSSIKGYTGHSISAAGALEAILTWKMLREGWIAPCVNATPLDPELDEHPPIIEPTDRDMTYALS